MTINSVSNLRLDDFDYGVLGTSGGARSPASPGAVREKADDHQMFLSALPAGRRDRRLAAIVVLVSVAFFLVAVPFAQVPLAQVWAFIPIYESALVINDLITAVLLFGQFRISRSRALLVLASGYLFTAFIAVPHALTFPGAFAPSGLLGAGTKTTAALYMLWHGIFPLFIVAYALLKREHATRATSEGTRRRPGVLILAAVAANVVLVGALTLLATRGQDLLPEVIVGNRYTPAMIFVSTSVWVMSLVAIVALWRRRPHTALDLWLMTVMCAWVFDIALSAVLNGGRWDFGFYAGRVYGLLAASFVLILLLLENGTLYARLVEAHDRYARRLKILHEIDQAVAARKAPEVIAGAVIQPLRELLGMPRAIINIFDLAAGEVEWLAAAGRRRSHVGPGVRHSINMMGDMAALQRGEPQSVDTRALPPGPEVDALLASGVNVYMVMPMIAGGELIGAISFGGEAGPFPGTQVAIAREVATQVAIAIVQARLYERLRRQADDLEVRVMERTTELAAQFHLLQSIIGNLPGGVSLFDRDLLMTACNDRFKTMLDLPAGMFANGLPSFEALIRYNARRGECGPGDPEQITAHIVERALHAVAHCFEHTRPDGTVLEIRGAPMPNGGFITYCADITERKRVADALREREERFRLLVSAVKDYAILMLDTDGRVITWNEGAQRIKGYRADEIIGQHFSRFYLREDAASGKPEYQLKRAMADGRFEDEGWRVRNDGSTFWAGVVVTPVRDAAGTLRGFSKVTRDLTQSRLADEKIGQLNQDLKQRAAQLEVSNKELEGFSYSVSHDLRSPLRAVDGYSQMLEEDYAASLDEEGRRLLGVIRASSRKMGALIDDLLTFSRLGNKRVSAREIDMNALVSEVIQELNIVTGGASNCRVDPLPATWGDPALLRQVWVNLLSNALKFSGKRATPVVKIGGSNGGAETIYSVSDNGAGFDMEYYNKLFGVFQRLHSTDEFDGTGVGLAIVQRVVTRHGGRVWAEGKIDAGATFYFALPAGSDGLKGDAIGRNDAG